METLDNKEHNIIRTWDVLETPEHVIDSLEKEINKKIETFEKQLLTSVNNLPSEDFKRDVPGILQELRKNLVESTTKRVFTTLAAYVMYFGLGTGDVRAENPSDEKILTDTVEANAPASKTNLDDMETYYSFDTEPDSEPGKIETLEKISFDMEEEFDFEKAKLNPEKFETAVDKLTNFLSALTLQIVENIESGKTEIVFYAQRSNVNVVSGGYNAGRGWVNNNLDLCRDTVEEMSDVFTEALKRSGISGAKYRFDIPENGVNMDNPNKILSRISFADVLETSLVDTNVKATEDSHLENKFSSNTIENSNVIIIDMSGSMQTEADLARATADKILGDSGKKIEIIKLEGGSHEAHANTIMHNLDKVPDGGQLTVFTDEPDSSFMYVFATGERREEAISEYKNFMLEIIKKAQDRDIKIMVRVYNPNEKEGGFKEFSLIQNPNTLIPLDKGDISNADSRINTWFNQIPG